MLDDATRAHCHHVRDLAATEGLDLFETLEKAGLITSVDKRKQIEYHVLTELLERFGDQQDAGLAQFGGEQTVTGAVRGCVRFIEAFARGKMHR